MFKKIFMLKKKIFILKFYFIYRGSSFNNRINGDDLIISGSYFKLNISYNILSITAMSGSWQNTCYIRVL